eukprot:gb/GFBE01004968.1/.p1 GENE.gb/GFBE01004968.1/~~gb/GFBE01004968.1/.p1  ORF type:complete len:354 (+),score=65.78 gb/GFBE01004968.1/:1-1062(+)
MAQDMAIARCLNLPYNLQSSGACYSIAWQMHQGLIVPVEMCGQHQFLHESKRFAFERNVGYVGRLINNKPQEPVDADFMIADMLSVDLQSFLRKQEALISGIMSVLFVPQEDGSLLEIGYQSYQEAAAELLKRSEALGLTPSREEWQEPLKPGFVGLHRATSRRRASSEPRGRSTSFGSVSTEKQPFTGDSLANLECGHSDTDCQETTASATQSDSEADNDTFTQSDCETSQGPATPSRARWADLSSFDAKTRDEEIAPLDLPASAVCREASPERFCEPVGDVATLPSLGSLGHPHYCQFACKYFFKSRGCKDGANCVRCHLCPWTRQSELLWKQNQMLNKAYESAISSRSRK